MSTMGEHAYPTHAGRSHHHHKDWTPYSAVSSFNLPAHYDSTLMTPVSMTDSLSMPAKQVAAMGERKEIKLSPSAISPGYHYFSGDEDYGNTRYNPPMKHKDPSVTLQISTIDSASPVSPFVCSSPYWGAFGVSATPASASALSTSESSPSITQSSNINSASDLSGGSHRSRQQTPARSASSYMSQNQAPILIAPNPLSLRPATNTEGGPFRQNSLQSNHSASQSHAPTTQAPFPEPLGSLPARRKRKTPPRSAHDAEIMLSGDVTFEDQVLIQLTDQDNAPWKEIAQKFNKRTGKCMKVPALQMRRKRLRERLRKWSEPEKQSLIRAYVENDKKKWETISEDMLKYGCPEKYSGEAVQKKWKEMHPDDGHHSECELLLARNLERHPPEFTIQPRTWSDRSDSWHDGDTVLSALSTCTMDEARSRTTSDAGSETQLRHLQQQQQQQQQQQNMWMSGS